MKVYIVGTSHQQFDEQYKRELECLFAAINPTQILIEKQPIELTRREFYSDRPEMELAYHWAITHHRGVAAFDHRNNIVRSSVSLSVLARANRAATAFTAKEGWQALNVSTSPNPEHLVSLFKRSSVSCWTHT